MRFSNSQVNASNVCVCTHPCASLTVCQCNWLHGRDLKCRHHTQSAVIVHNSSPSFHNQGRISCLGTASEERGSFCLLQFSFCLESQRATVPLLRRALGSLRPSVQTWHTLNSAINHDFFMIVPNIIVIIICLYFQWMQPGHGNVLECVWRTRPSTRDYEAEFTSQLTPVESLSLSVSDMIIVNE